MSNGVLGRSLYEVRACVDESKIAEYKKGIAKDEAKRRLFSQIKDCGGRITVTNYEGKEGYINKKSARKILDVDEKSIKSDLTLEQYWAIAADIIDLYKNSTEVLEHPDYKNRNDTEKIRRFIAPLWENNYAYITGKVIKDEGQKIHYLEISDIEKIEKKLEGTLVNEAKKQPLPQQLTSPQAII